MHAAIITRNSRKFTMAIMSLVADIIVLTDLIAPVAFALRPLSMRIDSSMFFISFISWMM